MFCADGVGGDTVTYTATVDHDLSRMENLLDQWTAELKKNVMVLLNPYRCPYICLFYMQRNFNMLYSISVSYTHLTLPTIYSV